MRGVLRARPFRYGPEAPGDADLPGWLADPYAPARPAVPAATCSPWFAWLLAAADIPAGQFRSKSQVSLGRQPVPYTTKIPEHPVG